jgi:hypothetical protein
VGIACEVGEHGFRARRRGAWRRRTSVACAAVRGIWRTHWRRRAGHERRRSRVFQPRARPRASPA